MVFRYLLRNWLRRKAGEKLREKVTQAAREEWAAAGEATRADESAGESAGEPTSCDLGVVFALGVEAGGLEDLLSGVTTIRGDGFVVRRGKLGNRNVVVARSGAGRDAAARATEAVISGHRPQWVISAGFAGALRPELARHDLVMADGLVDLGGNRLTVDLKVDPAALADAPGVHVGRLLSADRIVRAPREKRSLGEAHRALAVDMETFGVAEVCRQRRVRFLAVRIISDPMDEELPPDVLRLMEEQTLPARLGAVVGAVWKRPGSLKDMYRLKENALLASDRLAKFVRSIAEQLVPLPPAERALAPREPSQSPRQRRRLGDGGTDC